MSFSVILKVIKLNEMNFLAHIYLSGTDEETIVGNFVGDYVKGNAYLNFPTGIRKGILLHREIDFFTDNHPMVRQSKKRVEECYRKYAGIVIDIFYDYLLASNWSDYSTIPLPVFISEVHELLRKYYDIFPQEIRNWFPDFISENWLLSYSTVEGIESVLHRMSGRTSLPEHTDFAIRVMREDEKGFLREFNAFFPVIRSYMAEKFGIKTGFPFEAA